MQDQRHIAIGVSQIVSGLVNWIVMAMGWIFLGGSVGGFVSMIGCAVLTMGMCPFPVGVLCGFVGVFPLIVGVAEIISGILSLAQPDKSRPLTRIVAVAEILSVLYGGIISAVVGVVVLVLMQPDPAAEAVEILD